MRDANGNLMESNSSSMTSDESNVRNISVTYEKNFNQYKSPITIELVFYPEWIEGEAKIQVK